MIKEKITHYQLLTKYRMSIFGIALIWIYFRHTFFYYQYTYSFFDPIIQIGDCGVDIFMFLSGFGLYFSYLKYNKPYQFYKKRLKRIVPSVFCLLLLFKLFLTVFHGESILSVLNLREFFFALYIKYWFIGAILLFYMSFPLVVLILKKNLWLTIILSFLLGLGGVIIVKSVSIGILNQLVVYFARIPIFVLGAVFAYRQELFEKTFFLLIFFLISIPLVYYLPKDYQRLAYSLTTIGIMSFLPSILNNMPEWSNKMFSLVGKASLEFYLIHIFLFSHGLLLLVGIYIPWWMAVVFVLIMVVCFSNLSRKIISSFINLLVSK